MSLTTNCPKHGKQLAVGNWDECERCVIEDALQQERQLENIREFERKISHKKGIAETGEF